LLAASCKLRAEGLHAEQAGGASGRCTTKTGFEHASGYLDPGEMVPLHEATGDKKPQ